MVLKSTYKHLNGEKLIGKELFTFDEVKRYLRLNRSTLYKFVQEGKIPAVKVGRQWRFDLSEIDGWLKHNSPQTAEKRRHFRLEKRFPVRYNLIEEQEKVFKATGRNISEGGLFIETEASGDEALSALKAKHKKLRLAIDLPKGSGRIEVASEIAWVSEKRLFRNKIGLGLRFFGLAPELSSLISGYILKHSAALDGIPELSPTFPIRQESSIIIKRGKKEVYNLLKDIEKFPQFIKDINSVKIVERTEKGIVSDWNMNIDGLPLSWRQLSILDEQNGVIRFRMIDGDFDKYAGEWKLAELLTGTEVRLSIAVDWGVHFLNKYVGAALETKTRSILQGMLNGIKKELWTDKASKLVKFAFMIHPYDLEVIHTQFNEPACYTKRKIFLEKIFEYSTPFECAHVTGVQSVTGKKIDGELIYCPFLPNQILSLDNQFVLERVIKAAKIAEKMGARILGLGAYTAGVGRRGVLVARALNIPVTTGTAYTIATGIESTLKAAAEIGIKLEQAKLTVIGATGAIGSVFSQRLADAVSRISLVARNEQKLKALADTIRKDSEAEVEFSKDIDEAVRDADIVITATTTPGTLINMDLIHPGALIYDMSVPKNVSLEAANSRQDVLVVDGGVVKPPGDVHFNFHFGLNPGLCYACMAETMILALEEKYESYSLGGNVSLDKIKEISQLGIRHGFKLAQLRSFGAVISQERIEQVRMAFETRKNSKVRNLNR